MWAAAIRAYQALQLTFFSGPGTPEGSKEEQGWGSQGRGDPQAEAEHFTVDMDQWLDAPEQPSPDPMPMDHDMVEF